VSFWLVDCGVEFAVLVQQTTLGTRKPRIRGNVQPQIGQLCIIMTGVAGQDEGQMGIVTSRTRVMVEVTLASKSGEGIITKTKQPRSLVLLEAGLVMVQDPDGSVWVRSSQGQGIKRTDSGDSRHGAVE
jgi:hypothetical protein